MEKVTTRFGPSIFNVLKANEIGLLFADETAETPFIKLWHTTITHWEPVTTLTSVRLRSINAGAIKLN